MRKILSVLLVLSMLLAFAACNTPAENGNVPAEDGYAFGIPTDSPQDITKLNYISYKDVAAMYQKGTSDGYTMISALAPQFEIGGCTHPTENAGKYYRLDYANKAAYSQENASRAANTSGITVRFCTNASTIKVEMEIYNAVTPSAHMNARGVYGIDVYVGTGTNRTYCGKSGQLMTDNMDIKEVITLPGGYQEVQINLPLYSGARNIVIGFPEGAVLAPPTQRDYEDIVFYGSSITQGCAACRPGLAYANILGMALNADVHNLGFSASAKGEQVIAEYIAALDDISAFVMDYDYNNSVDGLRQTHYAFYKTVREAHPDIPIILMSRPVYLKEPTAEQQERIRIILDTYNKAVEEGDTNIYFVSGVDFFPDDYPDLFSVEPVHPNDLGMYYMAKAVYPVLKAALEKAEG